MASESLSTPPISTRDCWQFPAGLYGPVASVNSYARRMAHQAVKAGSWKAIWSTVEYRSVLDSPGDIFVSDRTRWYPAKAVLWRMNRLFIQTQEICFEKKRSALYEVLAEEMLSELWYCVSILSDGSWRGSSDPENKVWARKVLNAQIAWLPELIILGPRIANFMPCEYLLLKIPFWRYQWAYEILDLCRRLGHPVDIQADSEDTAWDLVSELIAGGIIKTCGNRFALRI